MGGEDLEAGGEVFPAIEVGAAAGDGDAGDAGEVGGDGENVGEVFLERIAGNTADFPRGCGGDRGEDGIDFFEGGLEIPADEGADFLGSRVVGVVVAGCEDVGAEDDAALDLGAEALLAGFLIEIKDVSGIGGAVAVADAVEAGQVRRRFRRGDDVVGGDGVLGVGEGNLDNFSTLGGEGLDGSLDISADAGIDPVAEVFFGDAELEAIYAIVKGGEVVGHRDIEAGGIRRIKSGDGLENARGIFDGLRERADLVERGSEGYEAIAGNSAVAGLEADDATVGGGLADGAAGVRTEGGDGGEVGHGSSRAAGRTAGHAIVVVGISSDAEGGVFRGGAHREFVLVHPPEGDGTGGTELLDDGGVVGGDEIFEKLGAASAGLAEDIDVVLDGDGDAAEGEGEIGLCGLGEGGFEIAGKVGTGPGIAGRDFSGEFLKDRRGGDFSGAELAAELGKGHGRGREI